MVYSTSIGSFVIAQVHEQTKPFSVADEFFSGLTRQMLSSAGEVLGPRHLTADNRIILSMHSFVVRTGRFNVLIDTCCGDHKDRRFRPDFHLRTTGYLEALRETGLCAEDIDFVMCTHLHWDHVGWNTRLMNGQWVPTFPNAKYIISRTEYEYWDRVAASGAINNNTLAFADSVAPVVKAEKALLVENDHELDAGIWLQPCPGHTPGSYAINIENGGKRALVSGDAIHHQLQLLYPEILCNADEDRDQAHRSRLQLIHLCVEKQLTLFPAHFPGCPFGQIAENPAGGFRYVPRF